MPMVTMYDTEWASPTRCLPQAVPSRNLFPLSLDSWVDSRRLLEVVQAAAERACGCSWFRLLESPEASHRPDDLLVLLAYSYLQGVYPTPEVVRLLDGDETLAALRPGLALLPEDVRQYRRERRSSLADCLCHALLELWRDQHPTHPDAAYPDALLHSRLNPRFLEPFYREACERLDRAVLQDSMALDF